MSALEKMYHQHRWVPNPEMTVWLRDNGYEATAFRCATHWCPDKKEEPLPEASDPFPDVVVSYDWPNVGRMFTSDSKGRAVQRKRLSNS